MSDKRKSNFLSVGMSYNGGQWMNRTFCRRSIYFGIVLLMAVGSSVNATEAVNGSSYYTVTPLFNPFPNDAQFRGWNIQNFGPVGIGINLIKPPFTMQIARVEKGSPSEATGKLKKGQIIESINDVMLKDRDPREILGDIITEAEATDGKVRLLIKDLGEVVVKIPVMGRYSKTWPLNCPKSDRIVRNLADLLAKQEMPRWGSIIFLLSTGEEKDLQVVRKWMKNMKDIGGYQWHKGYIGIGVCEYYLRTGDRSVLPLIKKGTEDLKKYMYNGGWSGRTGAAQFTYSTGTGQMHAAGMHCVTFLLLARMCGVDSDEFTLQRSLKAFYRFAGHGNVPYGDGLPEGGFRDNGKTGGLAVAMAAAARLTPEGESSVYAQARDNSAMKSFYATSWFHAAHTGGGIGEIWHHSAMSLMREKRPVPYRSFLDTRRWVMDLSRRHEGSIGIAGMTDRYDKSATEQERSWGTYFALTYTLPRKNLILYGAPKTEWCRSYRLPERPWGTAADDIFQSSLPAEHAYITMQDLLNEQVATDASLAVIDILNNPDVSDDTLLKYIHHPEFGLRCAAMRVVVQYSRLHLVLPLLQSKDPRLRHAGILAITGMFKGRAMPADKVTPEMFELVGKMIDDPKESWWVAQDAMYALKRGGPAHVAKHIDRLLVFLANENWMMSVAAADALTSIATTPDHYKTVLPPLIKTLAGYTTEQAFRPIRELSGSLGKANTSIKAFALPVIEDAYASIPGELTAPGGQVLTAGARYVRSNIGKMIKTLPGGEDYINKVPKMTTAYARSGKNEDLYRYSGTFTPNKAVVGTWHWAVWPRPKTETGLEQAASAWIASQKNRKESPKDVLQIIDGGKVKSKGFRGHFWSGDMLIGIENGIACKMEVRRFAGTDFLIIESGGFDKDKIPTDWNQKYTIYMRVK